MSEIIRWETRLGASDFRIKKGIITLKVWPVTYYQKSDFEQRPEGRKKPGEIRFCQQDAAMAGA